MILEIIIMIIIILIIVIIIIILIIITTIIHHKELQVKLFKKKVRSSCYLCGIMFCALFKYIPTS